MLARGRTPAWKDIGRVAFVLAPLFLYLLPKEFLQEGYSLCLYKNLTGNTCYGCGITHALTAVLNLRWQEAWEYNRLVLVVAPGLAFVWIRNTYHLTNAWLRKLNSQMLG